MCNANQRHTCGSVCDYDPSKCMKKTQELKEKGILELL